MPFIKEASLGSQWRLSQKTQPDTTQRWTNDWDLQTPTIDTHHISWICDSGNVVEEGEKFYMSKETRKFAVKQYALKMAALTRPEKKNRGKIHPQKFFSWHRERLCNYTDLSVVRVWSTSWLNSFRLYSNSTELASVVSQVPLVIQMHVNWRSTLINPQIHRFGMHLVSTSCQNRKF